MHDGQKVHEAVVVHGPQGVGHTIGSIVVVLAPVDASRQVRVGEDLDDEFTDVVGRAQAVAGPSDFIRAEARLKPVPRLSDERDQAARELRIELGDRREAAVRAVEELLLDDGPRETHA